MSSSQTNGSSLSEISTFDVATVLSPGFCSADRTRQRPALIHYPAALGSSQNLVRGVKTFYHIRRTQRNLQSAPKSAACRSGSLHFRKARLAGPTAVKRQIKAPPP